MTTIVYRDGIIAADSGEFAGGEVRDGAIKVLNTGMYIGGIVGCIQDFRPYTDWLMEIQEDHKNPTTFYRDADKGHLGSTESALLLANKAGEMWVLNGVFASPRPYVFDALGSGSDFAMGALEAGKTAVEAVETAIKYNEGSCGPARYTSFEHAVTDYDLPLTGLNKSANQYTVVG
mgnify:CR=1 FL=1